MTKYVGGIYEQVTKDGVTQKIHYVGDFALFISKGDNTSATYAHEYLHRDHIGSIVAISKGTIATVADVSWQANGAWGARRFNQWNGPLDSLLNPTSTAKGFTDHEHLDAVGLIHMNGRVYDPELGRFMSADPFVQAPYNSQSYNRYSYVFNNPLSFTDPSGFQASELQPGECDRYGNCRARLPSAHPDTGLGSDASYWGSFYQQQNQINQAIDSFVVGAVNFSGVPTALNAWVDVNVAINTGNQAAIGPILTIAAVEFATKKVEKVPLLGKVADALKNKLEKALRNGPKPTVDRATGQEVGRFVVDSKGNVMIEPVGGKTVAAGKDGVDTHTLYPNGSNYQRLNPQGHANNPTPHAHGHLMGTGPGMKGQGPSLDPYGNQVPWNSSDAHWPIN